jgi:hypothetical protein
VVPPGWVVTDHPGKPKTRGVDHQSTHPRRERVVVRKRIGEYLLIAYERLDPESPAGQSSLTDTSADQIDRTDMTGSATPASSSSAAAPVD